MPNRFRFLFFALLCQMAPVLAQSDAAGPNIAYRTDIPKNVAKSVPRQAKRVFWGTLISQKGAPRIGVQLYQIGSIVTLELWQQTPKKFVRINRIPKLFDLIIPSDAKFAAEFYWTDWKQKKTPVLVISHIAHVTLMGGVYRHFQVVGLPSGWKDKPSVQGFYDGASNSGDDSFSAGYSEIGQLELQIMSGDFAGYSTYIYVWDGKQFSSDPERKVTVMR
ncbi:hypothetical protein EON80_27460 [bacterium]|nr:MAG: hypothetical protein EON80_27460 [bacterium]